MFLLANFPEMPPSFSGWRNSTQRYKKAYCQAGITTLLNGNRLLSCIYGQQKEGARGRENKKLYRPGF
jgi:hypothetical protein